MGGGRARGRMFNSDFFLLLFFSPVASVQIAIRNLNYLHLYLDITCY